MHTSDLFRERRRTVEALVEEQQEHAQPLPGHSCQNGSLLSVSSEDAGAASGQEADPLEAFLAACCELHPRAWSRASDLWQAYEQRAREHQERFPLSRRAFSAQLKAHGYRSDRTNSARIWRGIAVVNREP
jgi:hypothetical protein